MKSLYQKLLAKLEVKHKQYLLAFGIGIIFLILIFILIRQVGGHPIKQQEKPALLRFLLVKQQTKYTLANLTLTFGITTQF